jgi:putative hemolysin
VNNDSGFGWFSYIWAVIENGGMQENSPDMEITRIDVRKVFHSKNPKLSNLLPGFVFRYLERIAHQNDINDFLERHGDKYGLAFARAAIQEFNVSVTLEGEENLPREGHFIFASNHPLGGFDGMILIDVITRIYGEVRSLTNDILMNVANMTDLFVPINKHGKQASEAAAILDAAFRSDIQILTFPAGLVSRYVGGRVMDLEWKKSFITKSVQYKRDVIPVYFHGRNSNFFYAFYRVRKFLGIKTNLEMFYLVDETFKHRNKSFRITFGKPIPHQTFDRSKTHAEWAEWVKGRVYGLEKL